MIVTALIVTGAITYTAVRAYKRPRKLGKILAQERAVALPEPPRPASWVDKTKRALQNVVPRSLLFDPTRREQLRELAEESGQLVRSEELRAINRRILLSVVLLALTFAAGFGYPLLTLLTVPYLLYQTFPALRGGYHQLVKQRRIGCDVVDATLTAGFLLLGYFWIAALGNLIYWLVTKLRFTIQSQSRQRLINIFAEQSPSVWVQHEDVEIEIPFQDVQVDDIVVVHTGEAIPIDGVITAGIASIDQHMLTGEAQPAEKSVGDVVFAATFVIAGTIWIRVEKAGTSTVVAHIEEILNRTTDHTSTLDFKGDELAEKSLLPVIALSVVSLTILGPTAALCTLCCNVGGNMKTLTPLSLLTFLNIAAKRHILIKDARALEALQDVDTVVFDKTGTLTQTQPYVAAIHPCTPYTANEILRYAATVEVHLDHPLARAIVQAAQDYDLELPTIDDAAYEVGYGLKVRMESRLIRVGSARFMEREGLAIPADFTAQQAIFHAQGYTLVYVAIDEMIGGMIELHPTIRPEAQHIVQVLRQRGLAVYILSGDHEEPTQQLAKELGIDHYIAETLPEHKATVIEQLQQEGKSVCFVGDGINDAIALKQAHVSISLRGASQIASDTAEILFLDGSLQQFPVLLELADKLATTMKRNFISLIAPAPIALGGIFFLSFRVTALAICLTTGSLAGYTNAILPAFTYRPEQDEIERTVGASQNQLT